MENKKDYNYLQYECSTPVYEQPTEEHVIVYENYQNVNYEVVVQDIEPVEQGCSFREALARGFDVESLNINKDFKYGLGKKLQPKTTAINEMKKTIDEANSLLNELNKQDAVEQPSLNDVDKDEPKPEAKEVTHA